MKIPFTINSNYFKEYEPSRVAQELVPERKRQIRSEDTTWDEDHIPKLSHLCVMVIVSNFENDVILNELPCWDKNFLLEILPTDLPLPLVIKHINDEIYWKRKVKDRWKNDANYYQDYGFDWKRMYLERHVQEAVEIMTPEGFGLEEIAALCDLAKNYVKNLNIRELQIMQYRTMEEEEDVDEFMVLPDPCEHINLCPLIVGLENLTELSVQFGLRNVGSDYKKSFFQFSLQDCRNLGEGIAKAKNLKLLRVHSCALDDDRAITLLQTMDPNDTLEALDFTNCIIQDDGATAVAKFMKNHPKLKSVNLCNNKIGEKGMSAIAFMLTQAQAGAIEYLNLKFNIFGNPGVRFLSSALVREHSKLKTLNLACCDLGQESGILLGEMLSRNQVLVDLDLSNNYLGETAGRALKEGLEKNKKLQVLDLRMTKISKEISLSINNMLNLNRVRALKGEAGVEREIKLMEKRAEDERIRLEEEAAAAVLRAAAEEEEAAKAAAARLENKEDD